MEDFLITIFIVIFFVGSFILKLFKGYMEEIERENAHRNIQNRKDVRGVRNPNVERRIGGANVFERRPVNRPNPHPIFEAELEQVEVPTPTPSYVDEVYENPYEDYAEKLRELESEIKSIHKKEILSGDICNSCYDYHDSENKIANLLKDRTNLANAIVMSEILSKPLAMRRYCDSSFTQ